MKQALGTMLAVASGASTADVDYLIFFGLLLTFSVCQILGSWKTRALVPTVWPVTPNDVAILIVNISLYRS